MSFKMVDMAKTPQEVREDKAEMASPTSMPFQESVYPYGLTLCFDNDTLQKLNLETDCEVGDLIDLRAMAKVTSVNQREVTDGETKKTDSRIELQIVMMAVENEESEEPAQPKRFGPKKLYNK